MSDPIRQKALEAALRLAATTTWRNLALADIAAAAGLSLGELYGLGSKDELAAFAGEVFDRAMSDAGASRTGAPRERLFDVIMQRFEAMEPQREGVLAWMKHRDTSAVGLARLPQSRLKTAQWALVSAGLDTDEGAPLAAKTAAIALVISEAERAWRKDRNGDFAQTMAALDKALREAETRMDWFSRFRRADEAQKPDVTPTPSETPAS